MKRFITLESLAIGEDTKLSEMYFGTSGLIFLRTLEGEFAVMVVRADHGIPTHQVRTFIVFQSRVQQLRETFLTALDAFEGRQ